MIKIFKKSVLFLLAFFVLILGAVFVRAEDDDEEEDEDEREEQRETSNNKTSTQVDVKTDVKTNVRTITLPDKDGDGFIDQDDPHPEVAEIYIVSDENKNGIVDSFEKYSDESGS